MRIKKESNLDYWIDSEDEQMYLDILFSMDFEEAENIYNEIKEEKAGTHLSNNARKLSFENMTYKNLRYLIMGCARAGAELRVKALAAFLYRVSLPTRLSPLVSNKDLLSSMRRSLKKNTDKINEWSGIT